MTLALVVDDNREVANAICQLLSLFEVKAIPAYGARACITLLRELTPDVIFMDINMPGLDGFEVISYLRREPRLSGVPFVIITADGSLNAEHKAHLMGAAAFIVKPATYESLEASLKSAGIT